VGFQVRHRSGQLVPITDVPWMRWQELVLHQADLDVGYELPDGELAARCLNDTVDRFARADPPPAVRLEATDLDGRWQLGEDGPLVTATSGRLLQWLSGRSAGAGLGRYPDGAELPSLPAWR
jgi:maleylpyruvate isomerase